MTISLRARFGSQTLVALARSGALKVTSVGGPYTILKQNQPPTLRNLAADVGQKERYDLNAPGRFEIEIDLVVASFSKGHRAASFADFAEGLQVIRP
jgi:hypothetical protein